jgi:hypothetical protein
MTAMADVTNDLIYEVLMTIQTRIGNLEDGQRETKTELRALRGHMLAMQTDVSDLCAGQAKIELRLERIERRLELTDAAV